VPSTGRNEQLHVHVEKQRQLSIAKNVDSSVEKGCTNRVQSDRTKDSIAPLQNVLRSCQETNVSLWESARRKTMCHIPRGWVDTRRAMCADGVDSAMVEHPG